MRGAACGVACAGLLGSACAFAALRVRGGMRGAACAKPQQPAPAQQLPDSGGVRGPWAIRARRGVLGEAWAGLSARGGVCVVWRALGCLRGEAWAGQRSRGGVCGTACTGRRAWGRKLLMRRVDVSSEIYSWKNLGKGT